MPYATKYFGFMTSILIQTAYIPLGVFSCWMLLRSKDMTGRASLSDLGIYSYGKTGIYLINALIAFGNLGMNVIFLIVFGDVSSNLLHRLGASENSFWTSRIFTQSTIGILLFYLILQKEIHSLKYAILVKLSLLILFLIVFL